MKKSIYYWSPCLSNIATVKATINSAVSLTKYSKEYDVKIIRLDANISNNFFTGINHQNFVLT